MLTNKQRMLILGLLAAGAILVCLFGSRMLHVLREFRERRSPPVLLEVSEEPDINVELIRDWMTIPFIARMYRVNPSLLYEALDISPRGNRDKSLRQLNEQYFPEAPGVVEAKIKAALLENVPRLRPTLPAEPVP